MNQKTATDILTQLAAETEATGAVPVAKLARLIAVLERGVKRASDQPARAAATFRAAASHLKSAKNASRVKLAQNLRRILADSQLDPTAGAGEQFQKENPKITDEEVKKINEEHAKHKDVVKDKHAGLDVSTEDFLNDTERDLIGVASTMKRVMSGLNRVRGDLMDDRNPHMKGAVQKMTSAMSQLDSSLVQALDGLQDLLRLAEKGDPEFWDKEARSQRRRYAAQPWESRELKDMEDMLRSKGYDPADAKKLQSEGMGVYELEDRLKKRPGTDGSLDDTHGLKRKEARFETGKPADPTQNMSPEDADAWKDMNEKYRDVVKDMHKSAGGWQFTPDGRGGLGAGTAKTVVGPVEVVVRGPEQGKYTATFRMEHTIEHKDRERTVTQGALALSRCADEISRLASVIPYK